ncbi:acyl-CoA dehydrogenase NM domain-like protein [Tothia fuscella]|uniref:Acyl-CoA dehydrogenase NM domain-like protein n=1 Tax=Tothia fuscella TaxID=1048955 RepID=A0A9P4NTY1_9PEZI|nr:acyl-CoA dehydrogenase NM domain-like protein [Tothia fuscella]
MNEARIPSLVEKSISPRAKEYLAKVIDFIADIRQGIPADEVFEAMLPQEYSQRWSNIPPILEDLKTKAKKLGLWNLWLHGHYADAGGAGFTNVEYGLMCEVLGKSTIGPETMNCSAPDTGNMEVLIKYGTAEQKKQWLDPLLEGKIRSAYVMTEPDVASSDAKNVSLDMKKDGNNYVLNGTKWWISSAGDPRCKLYIVFCKSKANNPDRNKQHSIVLVPANTPGITVTRPLKVYGFDDAPHGHCEVIFKNVRVPTSNIILGEGRGFEVMQGRMGPGRIHHCMRAIGCAERGLEYMIARVNQRTTFGKLLSEQGVILDWIAKSRMEIDASRLMVLNAADMIDRYNASTARLEIAMVKVIVPNMASTVLDRAIQAHGGGGISQDFPLARIWSYLRTTRLADGPDEVHIMQVGKTENKSNKAIIRKIEMQNYRVEQLMKQYKVPTQPYLYDYGHSKL